MATEQSAERGFTIRGDVEESWTDFRFVWCRVKHPIGGLLLKKVFDHVATMDAAGKVDPTAWNALSYFRRTDDAAMRLLVGVLCELAQCFGNDPFCLACHAGATQFARLGIVKDHKWLYRRLQTLTDEGVLACVDRGKSGIGGERRAAQYQWVWLPKDQPTYDFDELLASL